MVMMMMMMMVMMMMMMMTTTTTISTIHNSPPRIAQPLVKLAPLHTDEVAGVDVEVSGDDAAIHDAPVRAGGVAALLMDGDSQCVTGAA